MSAQPSPSQVLEEAADWFFRVRANNVDADVQSEWLAWIEADPTHRAAFAEVQQTWNSVGEMEAPPWRPAEQGELRRSAVAKRPGWHRSNWAAVAAGIVLVGTLALFYGVLDTHKRIATGRGEQQSAVLADGSRVELGGLTGIKVAFTADRRLVIADEGEAFYRVEHDPKRPFVVEAGPVRVTAVGTAFSVRREGSRVSVVVNEGIVDVATETAAEPARREGSDADLTAVRVKAGQRVQYDRGQLSPAARAVSTDASAAWRRGLLRFEDEPLGTVVASLNRYSTRRIMLADPDLETLRFTGTVYDDSVDDWLAGVQNLYAVELSESDSDRVVIRARR